LLINIDSPGVKNELLPPEAGVVDETDVLTSPVPENVCENGGPDVE
jgi:hypothetical protein